MTVVKFSSHFVSQWLMDVPYNYLLSFNRSNTLLTSSFIFSLLFPSTFSTTRSAYLLFSFNGIWLAMRFFASSMARPSLSVKRFICVFSSAQTTITLSIFLYNPPSISRAASTTITAFGFLAFIADISASIFFRILGCVICSSLFRISGLEKTTFPSALRFMVLSGLSIPSPNSLTISLYAGSPIFTTSLAISSASMRYAPSFFNSSATRLLPDAIPPVRPISILNGLQYLLYHLFSYYPDYFKIPALKHLLLLRA